MADQFKNLMIGIFVSAAAAIVVLSFMFLNPSTGDNRKVLNVHFTDIDKLTIGTRVTYAGRPVGEVVGIKEIEMGRAGPTDANGRVFLYDLTLRVDSSVDVYNSDKISARTSGLLGEKYVEISPFAPRPGEKLVRVDNEVMFAQETASVEDTLKGIGMISAKFQKVLDGITGVINEVHDSKLVEKITHSIENVESITASLNKPKELSDTLANIHSISQKVNASWENIDATIHGIQGIVTKISKGEGTLGRLLMSDEIYLRTNSIMSKLETTVDDVNHYGLLFHSDKGWQRLRARRLNLLQQLRTPQEFHNYFNDEVDQISTSISRVYLVLNQLSADPYCTDLLHNGEYVKVFSELMRRVSMLEEEVRLYNTQIVETSVHETELGPAPYCQPCEQNYYCPTP